MDKLPIPYEMLVPVDTDCSEYEDNPKAAEMMALAERIGFKTPELYVAWFAAAKVFSKRKGEYTVIIPPDTAPEELRKLAAHGLAVFTLATTNRGGLVITDLDCSKEAVNAAHFEYMDRLARGEKFMSLKRQPGNTFTL